MKWLIVLGLLATLAMLLLSQMARAGQLPKVGEPAPDFSAAGPERPDACLAGICRQMAGAVFLSEG